MCEKVFIIQLVNKIMKERKEKNQKLKGLHGWLNLLTAWLFIDWVIIFLITIFSLYYLIITLAWKNFLLAQIIYTFLAILIFYTLTLEFKKKRKFIFFAKFSLVSQAVLLTGFGLLQWVMNNHLLLGFFIILIKNSLTLLAAVIGVIYLNKSKRVKNTFVK